MTKPGIVDDPVNDESFPSLTRFVFVNDDETKR